MVRELLKQIIADQREYKPPHNFFTRTLTKTIEGFISDPNIIIISGMRRAGKSTIQRKSDCYFNFDDERLV